MTIITKYLTIHKLNEEYALLVNSLSGAVDVIDNNAKESIESLIRGLAPEKIKDYDLIHRLKERGYIFESEQEELAIIEKYKLIYELINSKNNIIKFVICPTMACNLRCSYCFETEESRSNPEVMSKRQLKNIFSIIDQEFRKRNPPKPVLIFLAVNLCFRALILSMKKPSNMLLTVNCLFILLQTALIFPAISNSLKNTKV